jgi:hypothetical protein
MEKKIYCLSKEKLKKIRKKVTRFFESLFFTWPSPGHWQPIIEITSKFAEITANRNNYSYFIRGRTRLIV